MNKEVTNWTSLIITLIGALNTASIALGLYHLENAQLMAINELVSVTATVVGVVMSHRKPRRVRTKLPKPPDYNSPT